MSKKKKKGNIKCLFDEIIKKNLNKKEALIIFGQLIDAMKYMNICHNTRKYIIWWK